MKSDFKYVSICGVEILFQFIDGAYWASIKRVAESVNVNYNNVFKHIKDDSFLTNKLEKKRWLRIDETQHSRMLCLPEYCVYGWILSLRSYNKDLNEAKSKCYDILYQYFKNN